MKTLLARTAQATAADLSARSLNERTLGNAAGNLYANAGYGGTAAVSTETLGHSSDLRVSSITCTPITRTTVKQTWTSTPMTAVTKFGTHDQRPKEFAL